MPQAIVHTALQGVMTWKPQNANNQAVIQIGKQRCAILPEAVLNFDQVFQYKIVF